MDGIESGIHKSNGCLQRRIKVEIRKFGWWPLATRLYFFSGHWPLAGKSKSKIKFS